MAIKEIQDDKTLVKKSVCWNCKHGGGRGQSPLIRVRDAEGKKTRYYLCKNCDRSLPFKIPAQAESSVIVK